MGSRDRIRPSGGSTCKIIFKNMATFSQDEIALTKSTSKEYHQGKLRTRQTLLPGITAQLYREGYGRPTTLAAMKYTNLLKQISRQLNLDSTQRASAGVDFGSFWAHCTVV